MTEQATTPAVTTTGTEVSAAVPAATSTPAATSAPDFISGLRDEGNRAWVTSKGFKEIDPLVTSAKMADTLQSELADLKSKALTPPKDDATPEEWQAFYAKIGRPEKSEGYEFNAPKEMPAGLPYDGESATAFKSWAHEAGLSPRQAQTLHDRFVTHQSGLFANATDAAVRQADAAAGDLIKVWGEPDSAGFKEKVQHADLFIRNNGGDALLTELKSKGLLAPNGSILSPVLAQAMAKAGKAYAEDGFVSGGAPTSRQSLEKRLFPNG